ncbi:BamA/TamA family outer membrane protein [Hymenobacter sp. BT188]|uniref:BamA/TamA family outer membrane protein n=1 Tax=Hymenobacter sp. BT188 TaxID=2763504 RepID=UPI0016510EAC|nr:BamA/TamA family outer membrane protein [Hymenobacter sp. BT188]MBC6606802.1 BamA/TamA family outer membrane protein [Hymenobacter sp. BT188]
MRFFYVCLLVSLITSSATAQPTPVAPDSVVATTEKAPQPKRDKPSFIPFPIIFSQPETGLGYGAAVLPVWRFGSDTTVRKSNARLIAWRTQKKQSLVQLSQTIFTPGERFLLNGELSYYYKFPINYYGFGPATDIDDESVIEYKVLIFNQRVLKKIAPNLFVGLQYRLTDLRDIQVNADINEGSPTEERPSRLYERDARERQNTLNSGLGPSILYDGRDNVLSTFQGNYLELSSYFNGGLLNSDFRFSRFLLDARHFQPLTKDNKTILATQLVGQFHVGRVPFRELANLGGEKILRGYYEGRYRDRQLVALQAEVRRHLFWRFNGVVFGGVGQVGNTLSSFDEGGLKATGGAGVRFQFNRQDRLNVRFDYGVGSGGSSGFYFSIGEAF